MTSVIHNLCHSQPLTAALPFSFLMMFLVSFRVMHTFLQWTHLWYVLILTYRTIVFALSRLSTHSACTKQSHHLPQYAPAIGSVFLWSSPSQVLIVASTTTIELISSLQFWWRIPLSKPSPGLSATKVSAYGSHFRGMFQRPICCCY